MKINFLSIIRSLLALAVFWTVFQPFSGLSGYAIWSGAIIGLITWLNFQLLKKHSQNNKSGYISLILPILFLVGYFGVMAIVSSLAVKLIIAFAAACLVYLQVAFLQLNQQPPFMTQVMNLVTAFLLSVFLWGLQFFFALPLWYLILFFFVGFLLLFLQSFAKMSIDSRKLLFFSLVAALLIVELVWGLSFWPVHFATLGLVSFSAFYIIFMFCEAHFSGKLKVRGMYFQSLLVLLVLLLALISSPWLPQ